MCLRRYCHGFVERKALEARGYPRLTCFLDAGLCLFNIHDSLFSFSIVPDLQQPGRLQCAHKRDRVSQTGFFVDIILILQSVAQCCKTGGLIDHFPDSGGRGVQTIAISPLRINCEVVIVQLAKVWALRSLHNGLNIHKHLSDRVAAALYVPTGSLHGYGTRFFKIIHRHADIFF
jgi:hypothetical protein